MYFLSSNGTDLGHTLSRADALAAARDLVTTDPIHQTVAIRTSQGQGPPDQDGGDVVATFLGVPFAGTRWTGGPAPGRPGPGWQPTIDPPNAAPAQAQGGPKP